MAKRKRKSSKNNSKILVYVALTLAIVALVLGSLAGGYYIGYSDAKEDIIKKERAKKLKRLSMLKKLEDASTIKSKDSVNKRLKEVLKKEVKQYTSASHEYDDSAIVKPPKRVRREVVRVSTKPKLAIIIDDVSVKSHINAIKSLGIPLTMSFLPPSKFRPNSATLAAKEKFYMVHLPMEAQAYTKEEPFTLRVDDSQQKITDRISKIKKLFPRVRYINNHTGSKFTSDEMAVNRLMYALNKQKINFIDSRTTSKTKVEKVMSNYGKKYIARDVFLDHHMDKPYIKDQIKRAIKIAKTHGTAIAIGHPHANTILALSEAKKLFKDVELVLVNRLY